MMDERCLEVRVEDAGERLDRWLAGRAELDLTRSAIQNLCDGGLIRVAGRAVPKNYRLRAGDRLSVEIPEPKGLEKAEAEEIPLDVVYEDADLLVVNKPKGMVVHPAPGNETGTLVNALLWRCKGGLSGINGVIRPGIVHRIDKNTSGLLVVAKNDRAHQGLAEQVKEHSFTRIYEAVVYGNVKEDRGTVNAPIGRSAQDRKKMCVTDRNAREAVTHYEALARYRGFTHVRCRLETGRTHQIRVHMAFLGHPVAGDDVYGPKKVLTALHGQCLHARVIGFVHPATGEALQFDSGLPDYFQAFLKTLREQGGGCE